MYPRISSLFMTVTLLFMATLVLSQDLQLEKRSQILPNSTMSYVTIRDTLLFLGGDDLGIYDISEPDDPQLVSILAIGSNPWEGLDKIRQIEPNGDYLYILLDSHAGFSWSYDSLSVVDISDIYNPVEIYREIIEGNCWRVLDMVILDTLLIVVNNQPARLQVYDISENIPEHILTDDLGYEFVYVETDSQYIYAKCDLDLFTLEWNGAGFTTVGSMTGLFPYLSYYKLYEENIFGIFGYAGPTNFQSISIENPLIPFIVCDTLLPSGGGNVLLGGVGNGLLIVRSFGVYINDITDPSNPHNVGVIPSELDYYNVLMDIHSSILFMTKMRTQHYDEQRALQVFNLADPANPEEIACIDRGESIDFLILEDNFVLLAQHMGIYLIDYTDIDNPDVVWDMFMDKFISQIEIADNIFFIYSLCFSFQVYKCRRAK